MLGKHICKYLGESKALLNINEVWFNFDRPKIINVHVSHGEGLIGDSFL